MKQWLMAWVLCLFMAAEALASPVHVRNFDAEVEVLGSGDIVVRETLRVDIPAEGEFHGIFRDVPVVTRWKEQGRASMDVLEVRLDGRSLPTDDVRRQSQLVRVYQRDRRTVLEPGVHEFFLSYRMTGQVGLFEENDELTWNVTGSGWEAPVDGVSCTVLCPPGAPFFGQKAWLGRPGSREAPVTMSHETADGRLVMRFSALRPVQPGEEFTVAAGWGKGFVTLEKASGSPAGPWLLGLLDAAIFLYFLLVWFLTGRDPKKGVIVPLFHPPLLRSDKNGGRGKELSPAATGYLYHKTNMTPGCFGAALISLAGRGCCFIDGNAKDGFVLRRGTGTSPYAEENGILEHLAGSVPVDAEHGEVLWDMRRTVAASLRREYGKMWKGGGGGLLQGLFGSIWTFFGVVMALTALVAVTGFLTGGVLPEGGPGILMAVLFVLALGRRFFQAAAGLFRSGRYVPLVFALVVQTAMLVFMGVFFMKVCRGVLDMLTPAETALAVLALLIPLLFSFIMDAPTREARVLLDGIEGLELYLRMAEGPELNALNPPERTLEHYRELLPYAVALGLEQAWGARFSDVLAASASGAQVLTPAMAGAFSSDAEASASSGAGSQSGASSSSSFGDGGGGAGSGGGGGGGGGC